MGKKHISKETLRNAVFPRLTNREISLVWNSWFIANGMKNSNYVDDNRIFDAYSCLFVQEYIECGILHTDEEVGLVKRAYSNGKPFFKRVDGTIVPLTREKILTELFEEPKFLSYFNRKYLGERIELIKDFARDIDTCKIHFDNTVIYV